MPGRRARTGRGWDAAPPRPPRTRPSTGGAAGGTWIAAGPDDALWAPEESGWVSGRPRGDQPDDQPFDSTPEADTAPDPGGFAGSGTPSAARRGSARRSGTSQAGRGERGRRRSGSPSDDSRSGVEGRSDAGGSRGTGRWGAPAPVDQSRDPAEVAREICLRQLAVRPRTRAELAAALARRGIDADVAASVLDRYDEVGIIDDAAFARAWVSSRHHGRGLASRALANELRQRGVDKELADEALAELDDDTQAATARQLVDRKLRAAGSTPPDALFRRLVGSLARKGYPPGVAIRVVKDALAARDADAGFLDDIDPDATAHLVGDEMPGDQPID
jgi:regulatory protein